jgi:hypothetical protein
VYCLPYCDKVFHVFPITASVQNILNLLKVESLECPVGRLAMQALEGTGTYIQPSVYVSLVSELERREVCAPEPSCISVLHTSAYKECLDRHANLAHD